MENYYSMVKENADERSELTARQDADVLLRNLSAYAMKKVDNKTNVTGVVNVTLNRPKVMAAYVIAALGNTSEQIVVEIEDNNFDTDYIKDFRRLAFAAADARLKKKGLWQLNPYLDEQVCIRGGAAARCLFQMVDGVLIPDIMYWDYRYVNYEMGIDGYKWASYGYGTKRKRADIESEAWFKALKTQPSINKDAEVVDVWTPDGNEIYLGGAKVFEQKHNWGFTPVVIETVSIGSMLSDADDIKNHGESIFFLIREAVPELNRLVSILQTHNLNTIKRAVQTPHPTGRTGTPPDYEAVTAPGASSSTEPGNRT
ncbi:MAG: hypothetical protein MUP49_05650 [Dehalococcoidia bacterium]|nr:hypothetical protein [Dehalococcoidia bacterium]